MKEYIQTLPFSYVATHNLTTSKFIMWLDYIPQDLSKLEPILPFIELRVLNLTEQMTTAGIWDWFLEQGPNLHNSPVPLSDLVRLTLLNNYGGIWIDTDCMFLRDLTPMYLLPFNWGPMMGLAFNVHVLKLKYVEFDFDFIEFFIFLSFIFYYILIIIVVFRNFYEFSNFNFFIIFRYCFF